MESSQATLPIVSEPNTTAAAAGQNRLCVLFASPLVQQRANEKK